MLYKIGYRCTYSDDAFPYNECSLEECSPHLSILDTLTVWPDWAIYWTLGNFLKPLATINLPKSLKFPGNFCIGVKSYHFYSEIIFGQLLQTFGNFFWLHCTLSTNLSNGNSVFHGIKGLPKHTTNAFQWFILFI